MEKKFYEKVWFAWAMLIVFAPVGIVLLFVYKHHTDKVRKILAGLFGLFFLIGVFMPSGGEEETKKEVNKEVNKEVKKEVVKKEEAKKEEKPVSLNQEEFKKYTELIQGASFIKQVETSENGAKIAFFNGFTDYKKSNPTSKVTYQQYKQYFETGDFIEKVLGVESVRLFSKFEGLQNLEINLPYNGKIYNLKTTKENIESFYGKKPSEIKAGEIEPVKRTEFVVKFVPEYENTLKEIAFKKDLKAYAYENFGGDIATSWYNNIKDYQVAYHDGAYTVTMITDLSKSDKKLENIHGVVFGFVNSNDSKYFRKMDAVIIKDVKNHVLVVKQNKLFAK